MFRIDMHHFVDQQERRAVRQHRPDLVDIVFGFRIGIVPVGRPHRITLDVLAHQLRELGIGEVTRFVGHDAAPDTHPDQRQIAQYVEQFVARAFVREAQLEVVEVSFGNLDIGLVAELRKAFELFGRDVALDDHDRIVQVAAFDQVVLQQLLDLVQENERPARGDSRGKILDVVEPGILVAQNFRIEIYVDIDRELVVGIGRDFDPFVLDRKDRLFVDVVVHPVGILLLKPYGGDRLGIFAGRTVHNRRFGRIDLYHRIIHAARPQRGHHMLDRAHAHAFALNGRPPRGVDHVIGQGLHFGSPFQIRPAEPDPATRLGRQESHLYIKPGM